MTATRTAVHTHSAPAMAGHFLHCQRSHPEPEERRLGERPAPPEHAGASVPRPRRDMAPAVASALALDPAGTPTRAEVAALVAGKRADGSRLPAAQRRPDAYRTRNPEPGGGDAIRRRVHFWGFHFAPDASVSAAYALAETEAGRALVHAAVRDAGDFAMAYIEARGVRTRLRVDGEARAVPGRIGWVRFDHTTSAEPQGGGAASPNLHLHYVVPNIAVTEDGRTGALDSGGMKGRGGEYQAVFHARLARNLADAGFAAGADPKTGSARLPSVPAAVRDALGGQRTREGEADARRWIAERGIEMEDVTREGWAKLVRAGARKVRTARFDGAEDRAAWVRAAAAQGFAPRDLAGERRPPREMSPARRAVRGYRAALPFAEEAFARRSVLTGSDMRAIAAKGLAASGGVAEAADLDRVTALMRRHGVRQDGERTALVWGHDPVRDRGFVTTETHEAQEREFIALAKRAAADERHALPAAAVEAGIAGSGLDLSGRHGEAQRKAIHHLGSAGGLAVQLGAAGSGKSTLLRALIPLWQDRGPVYGVALAWRHSEPLHRAGIAKEDTMALAAFLRRADAGQVALGRKATVVVDEAAYLGTRDALALLRLREKHGFALRLLGDDRQIRSVAAGQVVDLSRKALGQEAVPEIFTTVRQKTDRAREIATLFRAGDAGRALSMMADDGAVRFADGGTRAEARQAAIEAAAEAAVARRDANAGRVGYRCGLAGPTNADAQALGEAVRRRLQDRGAVSRAETAVRTGGGALMVAAGDELRLFARTRAARLDGTWSRGREAGFVVGNNGDTVSVRGVRADGLVVASDRGEGFVPWDGFRAREGGPVRLAYGYARTFDSDQGATAVDQVACFPDGTRSVDARKGYSALTRHEEGVLLVTNARAERDAVRAKRPLAEAGAPVEAGEVRAEMARNLSRAPSEPGALECLERAAALRRGTVRRMLGAERFVEAREARGMEPTALHRTLEIGRAREALAGMLERTRGLLSRAEGLVSRLAERVRGEAREARAPDAARPKPMPAPAPGRSGTRFAPVAPPGARGGAAPAASLPPAPERAPDPRRLADLRARREAGMAELREALRNNAAGVAEALLGKPDQRGGARWRYGGKGALSVAVAGANRGLWHDHASGEGGDLLALVRRRHGGTFGQAVAWARDHLGMPQEDGRAVTAADRARIADGLRQSAARQAAEAVAEKARVAARQETVARRSAVAWAGSAPAPADHPYLKAKGVGAHGLRVDRRGRLRVPMRDMDGKLWSLQTIDARGTKLFPRGGRMGGTFHAIGAPDPSRPVAFAEGFATGASVREATGLPVVVALNVGNKERVVAEWRARHPGQTLVDAADNDHGKTALGRINAGKDMAERLARDHGVLPALPPWKGHEAGSDWNDFAQTYSKAKAAEAFAEAVSRGAEQARRLDAAPESLAAARASVQPDRGRGIER